MQRRRVIGEEDHALRVEDTENVLEKLFYGFLRLGNHIGDPVDKIQHHQCGVISKIGPQKGLCTLFQLSKKWLILILPQKTRSQEKQRDQDNVTNGAGIGGAVRMDGDDPEHGDALCDIQIVFTLFFGHDAFPFL